MAQSLVTYPRIVQIGDPAGFTLTRANWQSTTPDVLLAEGNIQYGNSDVLRRAVIARMVGVVPNTLMELVNSRVENVGIADMAVSKVQGVEATIEPYKYRIRERQTRISYFNIASAIPSPDAGGSRTVNGVSTPVPLSATDLTVNLGTGKFATQFTGLARFFTFNSQISVDHKNVSTLLQSRVVMQVLQAVDIGDSATSQSVTVTVFAPFKDADWSALTAAQKLPFQPTFGLVTPLSNLTSDWESSAPNAPVNLGTELLTDWFGTTRETYASNELYLQGLEDIAKNNVNDVIAKFQSLDITRMNKQQMEHWERLELNSDFFAARIDNVNQVDNPTRANILALPTVTEHQDGNIVDRKASPIGIITQLEEQGQVLDFAGAPLNLNTVFARLFNLRRNRMVDGKQHDVLDLLMSRQTKFRMDTVMSSYLRKQFDVNATLYITQGQSLDTQGIMMFEWTRYDLPEYQMKVALVTHFYFEDLQSAFGKGTGGPEGSYNNKALGNQIWALDWPDIKKGILQTNEVTRDYRNEITAQADPFYAKTMKMNKVTYRMRSITRDIEFGDYQRHLVFRNFNNQSPILNYQPATGLVTS